MGTVTINQVLKAEVSGSINNIVDSEIFDAGAGVGIGTTVPDAQLHVSLTGDGNILRLTRNGGNEFDFAINSGGSLQILDGAIERLRIESTGYLVSEERIGIGITPAIKLHVFNTSQDMIRIERDTVGSYDLGINGADKFTIRDGGLERFGIEPSGIVTCENGLAVTTNITATGNVTAVDCFATSDARLKENIKAFMPDIDKLKKLGSMIKSYTWKDTGKSDFGLLAQDVQKIFPELVHKGGDGFLAVNYQKLNLMMLKWI